MILSSIDPTSRLVVQTVLRHGPIARVGVAQRTGLSSGSMTRLTTPLVAAGILQERRPTPAKQLGRPALPLVVVDDGCAIRRREGGAGAAARGGDRACWPCPGH